VGPGYRGYRGLKRPKRRPLPAHVTGTLQLPASHIESVKKRVKQIRMQGRLFRRWADTPFVVYRCCHVVCWVFQLHYTSTAHLSCVRPVLWAHETYENLYGTANICRRVFGLGTPCKTLYYWAAAEPRQNMTQQLISTVGLPNLKLRFLSFAKRRRKSVVWGVVYEPNEIYTHLL
jgi:hypothetical protein